jgi:2-keto-4-pentenoate hydratase
VSALVELLLAARSGGAPLDIPAAAKPRDLAAGYAVQRALAGRLGAMPPAGFKVGATGAAMRAYLGIAEPIAGFVEARHLRQEFRFADYRRPGVECEIALRLARDLPGPCSRAEAAAAVGAAMAAIELVDERYADHAALGLPVLAADQMFQAGGALGAEVPLPADLAALEGRIEVDGETRGAGRGAELLGDPLAVLRWLAGSACAAEFGGLRAGQVVFLGSVCPPVWLDGPCAVRVVFAGLGEARLRIT